MLTAQLPLNTAIGNSYQLDTKKISWFIVKWFLLEDKKA